MSGMLDADYFRMFSSCPENGFVRYNHETGNFAHTPFLPSRRERADAV